MNFDRLREQILERAIQGKLVPQLESEPGVAQITGRPKEPPFAIPEKWKWAQLKNVGKIVGGGTPKTNIAEYWENGQILWFTPSDLGKVRGLYAETSARKITLSGLQSSAATMMPKGTVLFSSRAPIGHIALAPAECCTNQGCKSFVANSSYILPLWAYWVLVNRKDDIISRASGTTFKEISLKGMSETWIPLPSIQEQQRIIDKIQRLFRFVDLAEVNFRDLQLLSRILHRRTLQLAIQGKLVPQLESESAVEQLGNPPPIDMVFQIPAKWKWIQLKEIASSNIGLTYSPEYLSAEGVPILRSCNIEHGKVTFNDLKKVSGIKIPDKCIINEGDILICARNGSKSLVGKCALMPKTNKKYGFGAFMAVVRSPFNYYLKFFFESGYFRKSMLEANNTTAIKQITQRKLLDSYVPLPPVEEQSRIVSKINLILHLMENFKE